MDRVLIIGLNMAIEANADRRIIFEEISEKKRSKIAVAATEVSMR